jgi:CubicO group peptidase (beta-lactamase class C family)
MKRKKITRRVFLVILLVLLAYGVRYAWVSFPLISGYNAKNMCSCLFVSGRKEADIRNEDLNFFPQSIGSFSINTRDSSVTGSVWGLAKRKAIYRNGLGCTLVNDLSESDIRKQAFAVPVMPVVNSDTVAWPLGDRTTDTLPAGVDLRLLDSAIAFAFNGNENKKTFTRAVLVVYKNQLVGERYAPGFTRYTKLIGWSMAKSFTSALVGILVKGGKLDPSAPAPVAEWSDVKDPRHSITIENLLQQSTGLDFLEDYTKYSDVTNMLFNKGDMAHFTARHSLKDGPGTVFYYSSGNSNILSRMIRTTVGQDAYGSFPNSELFQKLGMTSVVLEPDASGTFVGSSYIYATARDYARFGLLYYNDGWWNGERILPEGWVQKTRTPAASNPLKNYGYQFWLNGQDKKDPRSKVFPGVPDDLFYADGFGGQDVYIIPSKNLVIVRLGVNGIKEKEFLQQICAAIK